MLCCVCMEHADARGVTEVFRMGLKWHQLRYRGGSFIFLFCGGGGGGGGGGVQIRHGHTDSRLSDVRAEQEERLIVLCIDCGCFHALTHPRDHWERKEKEKEGKTDSEWMADLTPGYKFEA